jgi:hypothetical protein
LLLFYMALPSISLLLLHYITLLKRVLPISQNPPILGGILMNVGQFSFFCEIH